MAQGHPGGDPMETLFPALNRQNDSLQMRNLKLNDVDFCEIYDCYTFPCSSPRGLTDFCEKGEGGPRSHRPQSAGRLDTGQYRGRPSSAPSICGDDPG